MKKQTAYKIVGMIALVTLSTLSSSAFADVLYDCGLVSDDPTSTLKDLKIEGKSPLSQEDMESSLDGLKAYCCQQKILKNDCGGSEGNEKNPESPYIFDHLVSKGFFKLDNKGDGSKDDKANEWAEKLKEWEKSGKGKIPVTIQNDFIEARKPTQRKEANMKEESCEVTNYDDLSLSARYTAVCMQSACVTRKFFQAVGDLDSRYDEVACENMVKKRINNEMTYIQGLMVQKANTLMKQVWKSYMQSYFLESRRNMLLEKVANINESLSAVTMKVQEGTNQCSSAGG